MNDRYVEIIWKLICKISKLLTKFLTKSMNLFTLLFFLFLAMMWKGCHGWEVLMLLAPLFSKYFLENPFQLFISFPGPSQLLSQDILYSGEPLSHHVTSFRDGLSQQWSNASIFSNRVPNWRHESLDVFRILFDSENRACLAGVALRKRKSVKNAHKFAFIADENNQ